MESTSIRTLRKAYSGEKRESARRPLVVPARLTWKDHRGTVRIANVVTRNVSKDAVYVDWQEPSAIPMYRLVQFQVAADARAADHLPSPLRAGRILSAVFRVGRRRQSTGTPEGYALRLLVPPARTVASSTDLVSATA